jgi:hypothetical protein
MAIISKQAFDVDPNGPRNQTSADIGMDNQGNFVIAWQANDLNSSGIYARQFSKSGRAQGNASLVNQVQMGRQERPTVDMDFKGNYLVLWEAEGRANPTRRAIYGRRYDQGSSRPGPEFLINGVALENRRPSAVLYEDGSFSATWEWRPSNFNLDVVFGHYDPNNREVRVDALDPDSAPLGLQVAPQIAANQKGDTVVVWQGFGREDNFGIYAKLLDQNGSTRAPGGVFSINQLTTGVQAEPALAIAQDSSFVVAWQSEAIDGNGMGISARRFDRNGRPMGQEFQVNLETQGDQLMPAVAMGEQGNFVIAWKSQLTRNSTPAVFARYYDVHGRPASQEIAVGSVGSRESDPRVAMNRFGDFTIAWEGESGIQAQQFTLASTVAFDKRNIKVKEGKNAVLTLSRSDETHLRSRVTVDVVGGTATRGEDYRFNKPLNVTFKPGQTEKSIRIPILKDNLIEKKETILLEISEKDRAYLDKSTKAKITILDVPPKGRGRSMDALLGSEEIAVGKNALKMEQVRSGGTRQPLFASAEHQPIFGQSFDINPFTGTGSVSLGNDVPETPSLFSHTPITETPFALAASAI